MTSETTVQENAILIKVKLGFSNLPVRRRNNKKNVVGSVDEAARRRPSIPRGMQALPTFLQWRSVLKKYISSPL